MVMVRRASSTEVFNMRTELVKRLTVDIDDFAFKFRDVFRVMERHIDNA